MKTETFVELKVSTYHEGRGHWGEMTLVNMSQVVKIVPDKNWCRVIMKDGTNFLCSESYDNTIKRLK